MMFPRGDVRGRESLKSRQPRRSAIGCERLETRELLSTLKQDIGKLAQDLEVIHQGSSVTVAEVQAVTSDFKSIAAVATKPSASTVSALEAEIKVVVANGSITPVEAATLKKDVVAVLASANIPQSLAEQTATDIHTVITASGVTKADAKEILGDVKAIVTDLESLR